MKGKKKGQERGGKKVKRPDPTPKEAGKDSGFSDSSDDEPLTLEELEKIKAQEDLQNKHSKKDDDKQGKNQPKPLINRGPSKRGTLAHAPPKQDSDQEDQEPIGSDDEETENSNKRTGKLWDEEDSDVYNDDENSSDYENEDAGSRKKLGNVFEDEDDEEAVETKFEKKSRKREEEAELLEKEAELETKEQKKRQEQEEMLEPPTLDEDEEGEMLDLKTIYSRIQETVRILSNFRTLRAPNMKRIDYRDKLLKDICLYYGYNEFVGDLLLDLFTPAEAVQFFESNETARPIVIRVNTLKVRRRELAQILIQKGVNLDPLEFPSDDGDNERGNDTDDSKKKKRKLYRGEKPGLDDALQVYESQVPLGATPEYLGGQYMLQGAASMLPVIALAPKPGERVLDMCAAPGGKTTHLAALMRNTGSIFANDSNKQRLAALKANICRMGVHNCVITHLDGRVLPTRLKGFDRVLLDAPCTGLGVISRDPAVKTIRTLQDVHRMGSLQRQLLLAAIDACNHKSKTGGYIVYSTCSISVFENEAAIDYALKRRFVKIVDTGIGFGRAGFVSYKGKKMHPSLSLTKRFYPHSHNTDGFYVALLKKVDNGERTVVDEEEAEEFIEEDWENLDKAVNKLKRVYKKAKRPRLEEENEEQQNTESNLPTQKQQQKGENEKLQNNTGATIPPKTQHSKQKKENEKQQDTEASTPAKKHKKENEKQQNTEAIAPPSSSSSISNNSGKTGGVRKSDRVKKQNNK